VNTIDTFSSLTIINWTVKTNSPHSPGAFI
jgi:hypothetical protein